MLVKLFLTLLFGYFIGSIPWALIMGKLLYNTDIRKYGSGNLGATNSGRVLGLHMFIIVTILDGAKGFVVFQIVKQYDSNLALFAALGVFIGHCYPIFADFKGGKGVACSAGVLLAISLTKDSSYFFWQFVIPALALVVVVLVTRYMSLGSIVGFSTAVVISWLKNENIYVCICLTVLCLLVILKHHENIKRLINHSENRLF